LTTDTELLNSLAGVEDTATGIGVDAVHFSGSPEK
jgi:hypothetical protein